MNRRGGKERDGLWIKSSIPCCLQLGMLIFSIVPRFSEKCVTVTLSLAGVVVVDAVVATVATVGIVGGVAANVFTGVGLVGVCTPFVVVCVSISESRSISSSSVVIFDGGRTGDGDDNPSDGFKFDEPVKFNVSLSPPCIFRSFAIYSIE